MKFLKLLFLFLFTCTKVISQTCLDSNGNCPEPSSGFGSVSYDKYYPESGNCQFFKNAIIQDEFFLRPNGTSINYNGGLVESSSNQ